MLWKKIPLCFHYSSKAPKAKKTNPTQCNSSLYRHGGGGTHTAMNTCQAGTREINLRDRGRLQRIFFLLREVWAFPCVYVQGWYKISDEWLYGRVYLYMRPGSSGQTGGLAWCLITPSPPHTFPTFWLGWMTFQQGCLDRSRQNNLKNRQIMDVLDKEYWKMNNEQYLFFQ